MAMIKIVGIGGGTGLPVLLQGLKQNAEVELSAIVSVADNGGSSGRLRSGFGIPAVGDLRNCLVALSEDESVFADLLQHRFPGGHGLGGHSLGNLIVTALYQKSGSLGQAVEALGSLLRLNGRALPVAESQMTLCAEFYDGAVVRGESQITAVGRRIQRVWIEPDDPQPCPGVVEVIASADAIVLGPGSLYTSIVPNLLVPGVAEAIRQAPGVKIFVCNLMTQPGETDGFSASDHLRALEAYLGPGVVEVCLVHNRPILQTTWNGGEPVPCDLHRIASLGAAPVGADLIRPGFRIRHDAAKLSQVIISVAQGRSEHVWNHRIHRTQGSFPAADRWSEAA
jgi:uncharacterized cofD-like protein